MKFEFIPSVCKDKKSGFNGHVIIDMPNYLERRKLLKSLGVSVTAKGEISTGGGDQLDFLIKIVETAKKFVLEVSMKNDKLKKEYKCFDDLINCPYADPVVEEVSLTIIQGAKLSSD